MLGDLEEMLRRNGIDIKIQTQDRSEWQINPWPFTIVLTLALWAMIEVVVQVAVR